MDAVCCNGTGIYGRLALRLEVSDIGCGRRLMKWVMVFDELSCQSESS